MKNQDAHAQDVSNTTGDLVYSWFCGIHKNDWLQLRKSMLIISALEFPGGAIS